MKGTAHSFVKILVLRKGTALVVPHTRPTRRRFSDWGTLYYTGTCCKENPDTSEAEASPSTSSFAAWLKAAPFAKELLNAERDAVDRPVLVALLLLRLSSQGMDSSPYGVSILLGFAAFLVLMLFDFRRRRLSLAGFFRLPTFAMLDLLPPALTAGFALALAANLYPAAALHGVLQLKSPVVLAMALCLVLLPVLWMEGRRQIQFQRPIGLLFAEWLIFSGAARILLTVLFPQQQQASLARSLFLASPSLLVGFILIFAVVPPFMKKYEGLRILDRVAELGENDEQFAQPEYTPATPECPHPEFWTMLDSQTTEVEVLEFLKTLVTTLKPRLVVETGTFLGHGTVKLAEGVRANGFGKVITIEFDPDIRARAEKRFADSGLAPWIESRLESSLDTVIDTNKEGLIDLFYSDSHLANREAEIRRLLPQLDPRGVLVIHDASSHFRLVREAALRLEAEGLISAVLLSTPRGVVIAQRREGRI